ncbi:MAG: glycosyltransferase family 2 protein [Bacteroidales bacterium]|nr:glycosyltransferase family 2 protein [Bacteroidales bacterium]
MKTPPTYSVIVPVYNSETTLVELNSRIHKVFAELGQTFEVIYVEDGAKDRSWELLQEIFSNHKRSTTVIKFTKNYGQHNALFCGIGFAQGEFLITIDDDLQIPPEEIKKLIQQHQKTESDLVYGYFKKKKHRPLRNLGSKFLKRASKAINDTQGEGSSFKLFTKELAQQILAHHQNFVYIDELFLWYTEDISYIAVDHQKRQGSKSGYSFLKLFKLFFNITIYYTAVPLKIMTFTGLLSSLLSLVVGIRFIARWMMFDVPLGYTSIIVAVLFSTSLILFSLGIIGEYLNRLYIVQNKKPPYSIKKILK